MSIAKLSRSVVVLILGCLAVSSCVRSQDAPADDFQFHLEEARIADVHRAIQEGQLTCVGLVQRYLDRAQAYNGVTNQLVTRDGAPIPPSPGVVRAGSPLEFPTETVASPTSCRTTMTTLDPRSSLAGWSPPRPIPRCTSSTA